MKGKCGGNRLFVRILFSSFALAFLAVPLIPIMAATEDLPIFVMKSGMPRTNSGQLFSPKPVVVGSIENGYVLDRFNKCMIFAHF